MIIDTDGKPLPYGLTPRQAQFARNYIANGGNATSAAMEAGYGGQGNSKKSASVQASRALGSMKVQKYLADLTAEAAANSDGSILTADQTLAALTREAQMAKSDSARASNLRTLAQYHGLLIERRIDETDNRSTEELKAQLAILRKQAFEEGVLTKDGDVGVDDDDPAK